MTEIPYLAFFGTNIQRISLPAMDTVGESAFSGTKASEVIFRGGVRVISSGAFGYTDVKEVNIPEGLEELGDWAFGGAQQLEKLTLPSTLTTVGEELFSYMPPEGLTVYGYADTPILDYCLNHNIKFVDVETGNVAKPIYEKEVDGVVYRINPIKGTAEIIRTVKEHLPDFLVIPETVDGATVTTVRSWGLSIQGCAGLILPDTVTYLEDLAICMPGSREHTFIAMPNNEVYINPNYLDGPVLYFYLPEGFTLRDDCKDKAKSIFNATCIGYERHREYSSYLITLDDHADQEHLLTNGGVMRVDGKELTAIFLTSLAEDNSGFAMASSVGQIPITTVASTCSRGSATTVILGDYVRVVEDGAFISETPINKLYVPACLEHLPPNLFLQPEVGTIYGTTGTYAERYAKEHGVKFVDMAKTPFKDVPETEWYFPYVREAYWRGFMNGTGGNQFSPEDTTTRAMVVQVLYNLSGQPDVPYGTVFDDVSPDAWYASAVTWARACGVCNGTTDTTFSPDDPVTREQLAAFLYRYASLCQIPGGVAGDLSGFKDSNQISSYAREAMQWAVGGGIINGKSATTVAPLAHATRAEIATMLCRFVAFAEQGLSAE